MVAVFGRHLHSSCSFRHIVWQPLAVARFLLQPQLSGTLYLSMSSHHLLLQPFTSGWRHSCFNSHFWTSSSDITNYVTVDFVMTIGILATLNNWLSKRIQRRSEVAWTPKLHDRLPSLQLVNKKAELSQRRPHDAPNIWVPWKNLNVPTSKRLLFPKFLMGFCSDPC